MRIVRWEHRCKCARCLGRLAAGTQDVENNHHGHAGGAGKLLLPFQVLHAAICSMQPCHVIVHEALLACARTSTASSSLRLLTRGFQLCTQRDRAHPAQRRNLGCDALREREVFLTFARNLRFPNHVIGPGIIIRDSFAPPPAPTSPPVEPAPGRAYDRWASKLT